MGPVPLTVPSSVGPHPSHKLVNGAVGRARGFSAPGSFTPLNQGNNSGWGTNYPRSALPPLMVPSDPPHISHHSNIYSHSPHTLHPITPSEDPPTNGYHPMSNYSNSNRDIVVPSQYSYPEQNNWSFAGNGGSSSHNSSLSSLLNPTNGYTRPTPTINTSYGSPFSSIPMQGEHSASSLSPDSRPTTGYSMSSVSSIPYQDDYSRPSSSHHRPISPSRPHSSKSSFNSGSLSIRRARRHSQAMSPYPSPYDHADQRPSTSPQPVDDHQSSGIPRVRSMIQLPSVDPYNFNTSQADFAYSAAAVGHTASMDSMNDSHGWGHRNVRPSTSTSSVSAASHTSSSQANTPPVPENYNGETDINRCKYSFFRSLTHLDVYNICTDHFSTSLAGLWVCSNERAPSTPLQQSLGRAIELSLSLSTLLSCVRARTHVEDSWVCIPLSFVCTLRRHLLCCFLLLLFLTWTFSTF